MSTDYQRAREALGARLRELRTENGTSGRALAHRLGWPPSKVSKLETGRQTPTVADLDAWSEAVGQPGLAGELKGRLRGLETNIRSWRRQLAAGHRPRQDEALVQERATRLVRAYESSVVPGLLQTAEYARHLLLLNAELRRTPRDTEAAVRARMRRQEVLYERGHMFHAVLWEGAIRALICPPQVMAGQLDRLMGVIGLDTVKLGIVPLDTPMTVTPRHGFWVYDTRLVIVETIHTEIWLDDKADIDLYLKVWRQLDDAAVYGARAHQVITRARAALPAC
ncbi:helix-turn-helix domain-containing protein [Embleya sp. NPDC020886]|uniref:helix-turn-helix domain-containing protein n=1 Tax=Embleya sp. NPDC020886 TaxID=3363980 RepID=UPI003799D2D7